MKRNSRKAMLLISASLFIVFFNKCMNEEKKSSDFRGSQYAGSKTCKSCHSDIYTSYLHTAHNISSAAANQYTIKGSFHKDSNTFYYRPALKVIMEKRDSNYFQAAYIDNEEKRNARFDLVIGSGRKGQSYLYWYKDNLFQLPVSWNVPGSSWVNSPNFPPENVNFNRNIPVGCFECHSSFIKKTGVVTAGEKVYDVYDKNQIIFGIDCERCHGPAAEHVDWQQTHPNEKISHNIVAYNNLNRQQKLAMCAMCHSGARETLKQTFFYKPGETLKDYLSTDTSSLTTNKIDVHGKQYQLLMASKCFRNSNTLTCTTCHNPHEEQRENLALFSKKCLTCHTSINENHKTLPAFKGVDASANCIDCHMPARASSVITMKSQMKVKHIPAYVRTHYISIYPDETMLYISKLKKQ